MAKFEKTRIAKLDIALGSFAAIAAVTASPLGNPALAEPLALAAPSGGFSIFDRVLRRTTLADLAVSSRACETLKVGADELEGLPVRSRAIPLTTRKPS